MKTLAFPTFLLQEKELKGSFTTLSKRNYFCAKIKHETFQPKIKSDNALGNLITALLQEHSMKAKEEVSVEFCWKLNPVIVSNNSVPDNAISKMQNTLILDPDLNDETPARDLQPLKQKPGHPHCRPWNKASLLNGRTWLHWTKVTGCQILQHSLVWIQDKSLK